MSRKQRLGVIIALPTLAIALLALYIHNHTISLLQPRGSIGIQEKHLMVVAFWLSMIVVIPVFILLFGFAWRYRASNKKAKYQPDLDGNRWFEAIWWAVPLIIISILGVITYRSAHRLDPFKSIDSSTRPLNIQVVAMQWKWLFIYPQQNIASVNYLQIPVNTPIKFDITSDAPMNSFWIPQLGGQIYAMSGMVTELNLMASRAGDYQGVSANVSGAGFAGMNFIARASSQADYNNWLKTTKQRLDVLNTGSYNQLSQPSQNVAVKYYSPVKPGLFNSVIAKYQAPIFFDPEQRR